MLFVWHGLRCAAAGAAVALLMGCQPSAPSVVVLPGGDSDAQSCKGSAGYQWSVLLQRCVRVFETGQRLDPTPQNPDQTLSAFVLTDPGSTDVELFWPGQAPLLLKKVAEQGEWADGAGLQLREEQGLWLLARNGTIGFSGAVQNAKP
jgi:hypothetical protein